MDSSKPPLQIGNRDCDFLREVGSHATTSAEVRYSSAAAKNNSHEKAWVVQ